MPQLGDFGVVATGGVFPWLIRLVTKSKVNHAVVYVGGGRIIEAQPGGALLTPVDEIPGVIWSKVSLTSGQRRRIAFQALLLEGTPYSFLDIAVLAYVHIFGKATPRWARRRLAREDRLTCAQLVDLCYHAAGVELFDDGRPTFEVTPGDLYGVLNG